jgi:protein subunit release factor A
MGVRRTREARNVMIIEVHAAEGGEDARLLVVEQARIYARLAAGRCL